MRDANFSSRFWTGDTGREIREAGRDAQLVAAYLITGPLSNTIGLYYLPIVIMQHEVGMAGDEALNALAKLGEIRFAFYDEPTETVYIPEMAKFQLGDSLKASDNRIAGVRRMLDQYHKSAFFAAFWNRYQESFHLGDLPCDKPSDGELFPTSPASLPAPVKKQAAKKKPAKKKPAKKKEETALAVVSTTPEEVLEYWNASGARNKARMSASRRTKLRVRLREKDWPWREAIDKLPIPNDANFDWQPDVGWLVRNDHNAHDLAGGKYDRDRSPRTTSNLDAVKDFAG